MTDRIKALTVVLSRDVRVDDVEAIVNAILMVKGVARVTDKHIVDIDDYTARVRVVSRLQEKILGCFSEETDLT